MKEEEEGGEKQGPGIPRSVSVVPEGSDWWGMCPMEVFQGPTLVSWFSETHGDLNRMTRSVMGLLLFLCKGRKEEHGQRERGCTHLSQSRKEGGMEGEGGAGWAGWTCLALKGTGRWAGGCCLFDYDVYLKVSVTMGPGRSLTSYSCLVAH